MLKLIKTIDQETEKGRFRNYKENYIFGALLYEIFCPISLYIRELSPFSRTTLSNYYRVRKSFNQEEKEELKKLEKRMITQIQDFGYGEESIKKLILEIKEQLCR